MVNLKSISRQAFITKVCRSRAWQLVSYETDVENKKFICEVMVNAEKSEKREVSFDDAAQLFGWKSITVEGETVVAEHFEPLDEKPAEPPLVDKNFESGKCWMSQPRITTPMNVTVEPSFGDNEAKRQKNFINEDCFTLPTGTDD